MTGRLFATAPLPRARQIRRVEPFFRAHPGAFATPAEALRWLGRIVVPADGAWALMPNGKSGTTSTLHFLFHLSFGRPLTSRLQPPENPNRDQAAHQLAAAGVLSPLPAAADLPPPHRLLPASLRLTTVREPLARAVSGFRYLCRSHRMQSPMFFETRVRLEARTGFDWDRDGDTARGLLLFLEFLAAEQADRPARQPRPINSHFRPQSDTIRPALFAPDLIGRCEDLPGFFAAIAARLDRPLPEGALSAPARNVAGPGGEALITPDARRLARQVFAADYEAFGY